MKTLLFSLVLIFASQNTIAQCYEAMNRSDFDRALQSIESKDFENTMLTVAKQVTSNNCLSAHQVKRVTEAFSFDNTKLDYAKYAYGYVVDPETYYVVSDALDFSNSQNQLNEYVLNNPRKREVPAVEEEVYFEEPVEEVVIVEQTTTTTHHDGGHHGHGHESERVDMNVNIGGIGMGVNVEVSDDAYHSPGGGSTTTTTTTTTTRVKEPVVYEEEIVEEVVYVKGYNGPIGCDIPMDEASFSNARRSIAAKSFSDSKLTLAKQVLSANCLTCDQVKSILMEFDFESTKLEFAKYAYGYTYDLGNYYKLNDGFDFESSIEELDEYIQGR